MTPKSSVSEYEGDHTVDPKSKKGTHCHSTGILTRAAIHEEMDEMKNEMEKLRKQLQQLRLEPEKKIPQAPKHGERSASNVDMVDSIMMLKDVLADIVTTKSNPSDNNLHQLTNPHQVPLPDIGGSWSGPNQKIPYGYFKFQVLGQIKLYNLTGASAVHYLLRCVKGALHSEVREHALRTNYDIDEIVAKLDAKFNTKWRDENLDFRWESSELSQKREESPLDYSARLKLEASILSAALGCEVTPREIRSRFRRGLLPNVRDDVAQHLGPRMVDYDELVDMAEYYWTRISDGQKRTGKKAQDDDICFGFKRSGFCRRGDNCRFRHDTENTENKDAGKDPAGQVKDKTKTGRCFEFDRTGKCGRENCMFKHITEETSAAVIVDADSVEDGDGCLTLRHDGYLPPDSQPRRQSAVTTELRCGSTSLTESLDVIALLDTGSTVNLVSREFAGKLSAPIENCDNQPSIGLADGLQNVKPLGGSTISIETTHSRVSIWCWVVPTLAFDLVVGTPGLFQLGVRLHFNKDTVEPAVFFDTDALKSSEHPDGGDCTYEYTGKDALLSCGMTLEPEVVTDDIGGTLHTGKWTDPLALEVCTGTDGTSWYELKDFPWTDSTRPAPNLKEAIGRNRSMFNGLSPDEKIALQKEFQTLVDSGRVVKVKKADCSHFIPLRPVIKDVGPTTDGWSAKKVRLTVDGRRINQWVRKGSTDGDSGILANLLIWRCGCHAISLDLSSAFHGIKLGTTCLPYASIYIFDEFWQWTVLAFGWGFSPACLFQSIKPIMDDTRSDTKSFLCWYVDDLKLVSDSREDLVKDEQTLVNNLKAKDFHTQDKKRVSTVDSEGYFGHLGYGWFIPQGDSPDIIMITLPAALETALSDIGQGVPLTRRKLLAIYSSWYDPMGLYLSVSIKARLNMRLANQSGISWDDPLRGEDEERLLEWVANLKSANLRIPRAVAFEELYCYTDASGAAWAAILCCPPRESAETRAQDEAPLVVFRGIGGIFGSTNSMESWTIPKKELYALVRGCEAMVKVANILEEAGLIRSTSQLRWFLYTDSAISVFRLKGGDKKLSKIEAKWITYIRATCRSFGWCVSHVNGSRNVADSPSRGVIFPENAGDHACLSLSIKEARLVASGLSLASYNPTQGSHGDDEAEDGAGQQLCAVAGTTDSGDVLPSFNVSDVFDTNKLLDHQQRSTLLRELGRWYTNGKRWDETFTLPRRFVEVEGPLYEVAEDGLLYRISCVDTKGDVMKKVALAREDPSFINSVIDKVHDLVGHLGTDKVGPAVKFNFYCPRLSTLVNQRLRTCHQCQVINASRRTTKVWGRVSFKGTRPAQVVAIDFMIMPEGKFVGSSVVFRGILSITCGVTHYTWLRPVTHCTVNQVIIVLQQLFGDISYPACVVTDGFTPGTPWLQKGQLHRLKKWLYSMNVAVAVMPPHGGPYCGWFERGHAHVRKFIKVQVMNGEDKSSWPNYLGLSQLSMNISPYSAESPLAPIDLIFGAGARRPWEHRIVGLDDECFTGIRHLFAPQEYAYLNKLYNAEQERWKGNFSRYIQFWIKNREEQQAALQRRYGKSASNCADIVEGDLVLVYCPAKDKLTPSFCGPYKVTEVVSPQLRRIEVTACGGRHSTRDISPLQLVSNMVKYHEREEDPGVQHWLQCSNAKCQAWYMTDEITANRFKSCDSKVTCSFFGARCAEGGGSVTV